MKDSKESTTLRPKVLVLYEICAPHFENDH